MSLVFVLGPLPDLSIPLWKQPTAASPFILQWPRQPMPTKEQPASLIAGKFNIHPRLLKLVKVYDILYTVLPATVYFNQLILVIRVTKFHCLGAVEVHCLMRRQTQMVLPPPPFSSYPPTTPASNSFFLPHSFLFHPLFSTAPTASFFTLSSFFPPLSSHCTHISSSLSGTRELANSRVSLCDAGSWYLRRHCRACVSTDSLVNAINMLPEDTHSDTSNHVIHKRIYY